MENKVILSIKNLIFKEKPIYKLVKRYIKPYKIKKVILLNVIKLQLLSLIRIHLVVNISQVI